MRTVYYVTNRVVTGDPTLVPSYGTDIIPPSDPTRLTYGTAFVDDSNLTADSAGNIASLQSVRTGAFSPDAIGDLSAPGCNLLIFIHGFDNSFNDSITRAAYLQQWFQASGVAGAATKMVAFAWPSLGRAVDLPLPWHDYQRDQEMAGQSGVHLMDVFARLQPITNAARRHGARIILLVHSMGHWALQAGLTSWFLHGQGDAHLFDDVLLCAADEIYISFASPPPTRFSRLDRLTPRVSIYFSRNDVVLKLSSGVNGGMNRLGEDGPPHRLDPVQFPPARYRMIDCTGLRDYDSGLLNSHQYYRLSPTARTDITAVLAGAPHLAAAGVPIA